MELIEVVKPNPFKLNKFVFCLYGTFNSLDEPVTFLDEPVTLCSTASGGLRGFFLSSVLLRSGSSQVFGVFQNWACLLRFLHAIS